MKIRTLKSNVTKYPAVKLGLGSGMMGRPHFRAIFHPWFWFDIRCEIKFAFQRAFRGYDDPSVWGMNTYLQKFIIRGLLDLAENNYSVPQLHEREDKPIEEKDELWKKTLTDIAEHFYESLECEDSEYEKNEYEDEWHNAQDYGFRPIVDGRSEMIHIPKNGYTQAQVNELENKYFVGYREICEYKADQLKVGLAKLSDIFPYLWD